MRPCGEKCPPVDYYFGDKISTAGVGLEQNKHHRQLLDSISIHIIHISFKR